MGKGPEKPSGSYADVAKELVPAPEWRVKSVVKKLPAIKPRLQTGVVLNATSAEHNSSVARNGVLSQVVRAAIKIEGVHAGPEGRVIVRAVNQEEADRLVSQ